MTPDDLVWATADGAPIASGVLHALLGPGQVGGATQYARVELRNLHASQTLASPALWVAADPAGATADVALAHASALPLGSGWPAITDSALSYSAPTTFADGISLPAIGPRHKVLIVLRRVLSGASAVSAETNALIVRGTGPI